MRHVNEARRHRVLSLTTRLEAISATRRELLRQLEDLDAEAISVSHERNILHNLDVPIAYIPDEVLAMIFEEGILPRKHGHRFGVVLSHVSHRWRNVATTTPTLWTYLRLQEKPHDESNDEPHDEGDDEPHDEGDDEPHDESDDEPHDESDDEPHDEGDDEPREEGDHESPELLREFTRASAFLSRSRLCPVDIYIEGFEDVTPEFIQLIGEHVGHCRELRTREVGGDCLNHLLECFSSKPIPLLTSIDLDSKNLIVLPEQLFPHGAPHLTTVQLDSIKILDIHFHLAAFSSVTSLQLTAVDIDDSEGHSSFRDGLMALPSLHYLEIQLHWFEAMPHHLPIVLPTIQFLHIDASDCYKCLGPFISILHAASLATISLTAWNNYPGLEPPSPHIDFGDDLELHLPSLKHLILAESDIWGAEDFEMFAQTFPDIERLSIEIMADLDLYLMLSYWPKLQTIAISEFEELADAYDFHSVVLECQEAGHPIRRLMLPEAWLFEANAEDAVELRKLVVVEWYYVDWPTPFKREYLED